MQVADTSRSPALETTRYEDGDPVERFHLTYDNGRTDVVLHDKTRNDPAAEHLWNAAQLLRPNDALVLKEGGEGGIDVLATLNALVQNESPTIMGERGRCICGTDQLAGARVRRFRNRVAQCTACVNLAAAGIAPNEQEIHLTNGAVIRCPGYEIWADFVGRRRPAEKYDETVIPRLDASCPAARKQKLDDVLDHALLVTGKGVPIQSGRDVYYEVKAGNSPPVWVTDEAVSNAHRFAELRSAGVHVSSDNQLAVVRLLRKMIGNSDLPARPFAQRVGEHYRDEAGALHVARPGRDVGFISGLERVRAALTPCGEARQFTDWLAGRWLVRDTQVQFVFGAAAAAVMLRELDLYTFVLHARGDTGGGKTALQTAAVSMFGDPDVLAKTLNRTEKSETEIFNQLTDLPIVLDEQSAIADDPGRVARTAYAMSLQKPRERTTRTGGLLPTVAPWRTVVLMSGEEPPFADDGTREGALNRTLCYNHRRLDNPSEPYALAAHAGHVGRMLLEWWERANASREETERTRAYFRERFLAPVVERVGEEGRRPSALAVTAFGVYALTALAVFPQAGHDRAYAAAMDVIDAYVDIAQVVRPANSVAAAVNALRSDIRANPQCYVKYGENPPSHKEVRAYWFEDPTDEGRVNYAYLKSAYKRVLEEAGFKPFNRLDNALTDAGILVHRREKNGKGRDGKARWSDRWDHVISPGRKVGDVTRYRVVRHHAFLEDDVDDSEA